MVPVERHVGRKAVERRVHPLALKLLVEVDLRVAGHVPDRLVRVVVQL